jgi:polyhydroxyalkanoate synthase
VHKVHLMFDGAVTFVLTSGGHNAGIVSEPGHRGRHYRLLDSAADAPYLDPDDWLEVAESRHGSWWPAWVDWLSERSGTPVPPPSLGAAELGYPALEDAPGSYVVAP